MPHCYTCSRYRPSHQKDPFKQLLLGSSQDGLLTILPPSTSPSIKRQNDAPLNTPFITRLSDELLDEILSHLTPIDNSISASTTIFYQTALPILVVSKHFYRLALPRMYRTIQLTSHSLAQPCWAIRQFHRAIKANRALGAMVRALRVNVEYRMPRNASEIDYNTAIEILNFCPNIESFDLRGGYKYPSTWSMIKTAVANWPQITCVGLSAQDASLYMPPICELIMATPNLRTLNLYGVYDPNQGTSTPHPIWTPPSKDSERKSNITTLIIHRFIESPEAIQNLLKLPRALEHFAFSKIFPFPFRWSLDMFQSLLSLHQQTLKSIEIGYTGQETWPINFLDFPRLEELNLSYWVYKNSPEVVAATLLAPRIHTLVWNFAIIGQQSEFWDDFGGGQKEWLLKFAEIAATRKSALRKIEIVFPSGEWTGPKTREELAAVVSTPSELMADARAKIKLLGIELEWTGGWSREGCLKRIERTEKERRLLEEDMLERGQEEKSSRIQDMNEWSDSEESLT